MRKESAGDFAASRWLAMKTLLAVLLLSVPSAVSAATRPLKIDAASILTLHGDSTLHSYSSTATVLSAVASLEMEADGAIPLADTLKRGTARLVLAIPVSGLKSGKGALDGNMRKALKANKHPEIRFTLDSLSVVGAKTVAEGRLLIAGTEKPIQFEPVVTATESAVRARGQYDLRMSEYGIKPPTMMLGAIRTRDEVTIKFDLTLTEAR